jgi:hypothetical protein
MKGANAMDLTTIFCQADEFCKYYEKNAPKELLERDSCEVMRRGCSMSRSELMALTIYYAALSTELKTFKAFYKYRYDELKSAFPGLLSYNRIIELREELLTPLAMFFISLFAHCTGTSWIDSTKIIACHNKRQYSHKTLKAIAAKGKTGDGWFYGLKLHAVVNEFSEFVMIMLTPGNVADNSEAVINTCTRHLQGLLFGDKGYILSPERWRELYERGLKLIHGLRANMRNKFVSLDEKLLLSKRANICESPFSKLKDRMSLQSTKHRSLYGFFCNTLTMLIAYQLWARERARILRQKTLQDLPENIAIITS